ncbi:MAG: penicillin-binding transpeptidase domain-containing protein [Acidimicrobiia bacterium]
MNPAMRRIAAVSLGAMGFLAVWLTFQQVTAGSTYSDDPRNVRALGDTDDDRRGIITTAEGIVVAEDVEGIRSYPEGTTYFHLVGYAAADFSTALESTRAGDLRSLDDGSITSWLITLFGGSVEPPEVRLTVVDRIQQVAARELEGLTGAIVAVEPATGAVLAYASSPAADPNDLVSGEITLEEHLKDRAALDRVAFRLLPSGSAFKVLVAAAALESGMTPETELEDSAEYLAPGAGQPIVNVSGGRCSGGNEISLSDALAVSCNTVFASIAVELGGAVINEIAERAGFNRVLPFELGAAVSSIPSAGDLSADEGALAQTGLGERDLRVTPLQMAVIAAGIGNGGMMMQPYVVDSVLTRDGSKLSGTSAKQLGRVMDGATAADLTAMMAAVVSGGTGRATARADVTVAGKTGTAEGSGGPHAWFIAFAPAEQPTIAIVVMIEGGGSGGSIAAPIAARVLDAWFQR